MRGFGAEDASAILSGPSAPDRCDRRDRADRKVNAAGAEDKADAERHR
jgi:hypothetical protein